MREALPSTFDRSVSACTFMQSKENYCFHVPLRRLIWARRLPTQTDLSLNFMFGCKVHTTKVSIFFPTLLLFSRHSRWQVWPGNKFTGKGFADDQLRPQLQKRNLRKSGNKDFTIDLTSKKKGNYSIPPLPLKLQWYFSDFMIHLLNSSAALVGGYSIH